MYCSKCQLLPAHWICWSSIIQITNKNLKTFRYHWLYCSWWTWVFGGICQIDIIRSEKFCILLECLRKGFLYLPALILCTLITSLNRLQLTTFVHAQLPSSWCRYLPICVYLLPNKSRSDYSLEKAPEKSSPESTELNWQSLKNFIVLLDQTLK